MSLAEADTRSMLTLSSDDIAISAVSSTLRDWVLNMTLNVITRRIMYMIAENIALKEKCNFLLTGENLAQVSSQTLPNMANITSAVNIEILRPLLCNDKVETINLAREIGTYEICSGPELCSFLGPKHPATKSNIEIVENEESKIDINNLIKESLNAMKHKFYNI